MGTTKDRFTWPIAFAFIASLISVLVFIHPLLFAKEADKESEPSQIEDRVKLLEKNNEQVIKSMDELKKQVTTIERKLDKNTDRLIDFLKNGKDTR